MLSKRDRGAKVAAVVVGAANLGIQRPRRAVLYLDGVTPEALRQACLAATFSRMKMADLPWLLLQSH